MIISLRDIAHPKAIGKRVAKLYSIPLTKGQAWSAQMLGYAGWPALLEYFKHLQHAHSSGDFSAPDELCMPSAVEARRAFQSAVLARLSNESLQVARRHVDRIAPSGNFKYTPQRPWVWEDGAEHVPRRLDPVWTPEDHAQAFAALDTILQRGARRHVLAQPVKALVARFQSLAFCEYPPEQWGEPEWYLRYRALNIGHWSRNMQRWLSEPDAQRLRAAVASLAPIVAKGRTMVVDERERLDDVATYFARIAPRIERWRGESVAHDGKPPVWVGDSPEKIAGERVLLELIVPRQHWPKSGAWTALTFVHDMHDRFYERAKEKLAALPAREKARPDVAMAARIVTKHFRDTARWAEAHRKQFAPADREWLVLPRDRLGSEPRPVRAPDSPAARAAGAGDGAEQIAVSAAMLKLLRASSFGANPDRLFSDRDGLPYGVRFSWLRSGTGTEGTDGIRGALNPRVGGLGVEVNANHRIAEHFVYREYSLQEEPRALLMFTSHAYYRCWPKLATARQIVNYLRCFDQDAWRGGPLSHFERDPAADDDTEIRSRQLWDDSTLAIHVRGIRSVLRLRILWQAVLDEDLAVVFDFDDEGSVGYGTLSLLIPGLMPAARLYAVAAYHREVGLPEGDRFSKERSAWLTRLSEFAARQEAERIRRH